MRIALLRGRDFTAADDETAPGVVIVDEQLAEHFWPGRDPVGRRMFKPQGPELVRPDEHTRWLTVVGVVRSVRLQDLAGTRTPFGAYYFPYAQEPWRGFTFAVRTSSDLAAMTQAVRAAVARVDPQLALFDIHSMEERAWLSVASRRTALLLASGFGGLALLLAAIGIHGVLAYLVAVRRREIGIRVALGSTLARIVRLVVGEGLTLAAIGLAAGLAAAAAFQKAISSQLYDVRPLDPLVLAGVAGLLGVVAMVACLVPARRAARVDPVRVLAEQ